MAGLTDKLFKGSALLSLARVLINFAKAASTILIAWFLAPEDYGLVAVAYSVLMILSSVTEMQLGEALIRQDAKDKNAIHTIWTLGLIRGLILSLIMLALAKPLAQFFEDDRLTAIFLVLSVHPLIAGIINPQVYVKQRDLNFLYEFLLTVIQKLLGAVIMVTLAYILGNYWALIIGAVFEVSLGTVLSFALLRYRPRLSLKSFKAIWGFSLWMSLRQIVDTLSWRLDALFVGKWLSLPQLGLYNFGNNLAQLPTRELMTPVRKVAFPGFTAVVTEHEKTPNLPRVHKTYQRVQSFTTAVAFFIGISFACLADTLIAAVLNDKWQGTILIVQVLSATFAIQTLGSLAHPLAMACNQTKRLFFLDATLLCIRLPIVLCGLAIFALPGLIFGRAASSLIAIYMRMRMVRSMIGLSIWDQLNWNLRSLMGAAIMVLGLWAIKSMIPDTDNRLMLLAQLGCEGILAALLYFGSTGMLWLLQGRPEGPETELLGLLQRFNILKKA